jgi:hypothetical protein
MVSRAAAAGAIRRVMPESVSDISQVRGARMTGQSDGSMQCTGQSQSANEANRVPSGASRS